MGKVQVYELEDLAYGIESEFRVDAKYSRQTLNPWLQIFTQEPDVIEDIIDWIEDHGIYMVKDSDYSDDGETSYLYIKGI